jgi:hypothetical protein
MPTISFFYGIKIQIFWDEHPPPHFHAKAGDERVSIRIDDLTVLSGDMSPRLLALVLQWGKMHQVELLEAWNRCEKQEQPLRIAPLQ